MSNLVHNERIKLQAAYLNNVSVGALLGAVFIPIMLKVWAGTLSLSHALIFCSGPLVLSFALHRYAVWTLRGLKE